MQKDAIRSTLASLDLSDKEISLYLLLLQSGTAPASSLGDRAGLVRSTAQYTCQQLEKKGSSGWCRRGICISTRPSRRRNS